MKRHTVAWSVASLAVCLVAAAGAVQAQNTPAQGGAGTGFGPPGMGHFQRPAFTPTRVQGTVARAIVGPLGHVRGLLLDTGTVVMLGHHHGHGPDTDPTANTTSPVPVGTTVVVDGFTTAASANTVYRATVYDRAGTTVLVQPPARPAWAGQGGPSGAPSGAPPGGPGQWHHHFGGGPGGHHGFGGGPGGHRGQMFQAMAQLPARSASGVIRAVLTGPHGEAHGVVLHDGTSVFLGPGLAHQLPAGSLAAGQALRAEGQGNQYPAGGSMFARQVTLANGAVFNAPARPVPPPTATP